MEGVSTDGDPRALNCMKHSFKCMMDSLNNDVLMDLKSEQDVSFIQDPIHIASKFRNRLLKSSIVLPIGSKQVSVSHLKILVDSVPKHLHGLILSDIIPDDKQNYKSFEKITENRVFDSLNRTVIGSEATIMYLKISKQIISSFSEVDLEPLKRIYLIWHSLYFLRAWRKWIKKSILYTLEQNFISSNAFACVEINAYGLLHLITKFRDADTPHLLLPTLFQSQACEKTFCQMRSMTTVYWTRINFNLLELFQIIGRIELQNEIVFSKLANTDVSIPRIQTRSDKCIIYALPSNEQIQHTLMTARNDALKDASKLDMHFNPNEMT